MPFPHLPHPRLYQINTRTWLQAHSAALGRRATLDDVPDTELDEWAQTGFDWIYLLGVWQTGERGRIAALQEPWLLSQAQLLLPQVSIAEDSQADAATADICGSCFAIQAYRVNPRLGDENGLQRFRQRLHARGMSLMLDFVPNHTAIDHRWAFQHPDYYISGTQADLQTAPQAYVQVETIQGLRILAHGRDPYFPPWSDTLQLNYGSPALQAAMTDELLGIAGQCDGLRCDMAMLLLPGVIERVWGLQAAPFWSTAIGKVREAHPEFTFLAEVYWGLEWTLQQEGFDYTYDKELYDRLRGLHAHPVREHLHIAPAIQGRMARFLENHDETRAASEFPDSIHPAAAVIAYLTPGLRFFHQGQLDGYLERVPMQFCRAPVQKTNATIQGLYSRVLKCLQEPALRHGDWHLIDTLPGAIDDRSWEDVIAWQWQAPDAATVLVVVNYSPQAAGFILRQTQEELRGQTWQLLDLLDADQTAVSGAELQDWVFPDLRLSLPAWGVRVFHCTPGA